MYDKIEKAREFGYSDQEIKDYLKQKYPLLRYPHESELEYFKKNPNVAGMATEDGKVIFNPFSEVIPNQANSIYKNESSRIFMRQGNRPQYDLTEEQKKNFSGYGSLQDMRETIAARALSGDPSAGQLTEEQKKYSQDLENRMSINK